MKEGAVNISWPLLFSRIFPVTLWKGADLYDHYSKTKIYEK